MKKIRIGIDINEVIRAKWLQFDKFYIQEFGETGVPNLEDPYVFDLFNTYKWENIEETEKELKEPDEMPDNINPLDYQVDKKTGESIADFALFKTPTKVKLTAKEVYNRFMYEDFVYEIHGSAPVIYRGVDLDLNIFYNKYKEYAEFKILSIENVFSIPSTLFFLSKIACRINDYSFVNKYGDMWKDVDVLITTDPNIMNTRIPFGKSLIKIKRPYNDNIGKPTIETTELINLLTNDNFNKIIRYKNK